MRWRKPQCIRETGGSARPSKERLMENASNITKEILWKNTKKYQQEQNFANMPSM